MNGYGLGHQQGGISMIQQGQGLDLRTANAGQLQDAARRRHGELADKVAKLRAEATAHENEMAALETMFPKQEVTT